MLGGLNSGISLYFSAENKLIISLELSRLCTVFKRMFNYYFKLMKRLHFFFLAKLH